MDGKKKYELKDSKPPVIEESAAAYSAQREMMRNVSLFIPQSDMNYLEELIKLRGWEMSPPMDLLDDFLASRPKCTDLSEDDVMEEVRAVRYGDKGNRR